MLPAEALDANQSPPPPTELPTYRILQMTENPIKVGLARLTLVDRFDANVS